MSADTAALRVVVTGGSSGIGAAIVRALTGARMRVLAVARRAERLDAVAGDTGADTIAADIAKETGVAEIVAAAESTWGAPPDAVVHSAGAFHLAPLAETTPRQFDEMLAVNLRAAFLLAHAWLPAMLARGSGQFIWIGSVAGRVALAGNAGYSASKYGLRGLHEVLDAELRGTGVRSTLIEPAATATELWDSVDRGRYPDLPPADAMLPAAEVADAVLWSLRRPASVAMTSMAMRRS